MSLPTHSIKHPGDAQFSIVCDLCGAVIGDIEAHETWHDGLLGPRSIMDSNRKVFEDEIDRAHEILRGHH